MKEDKQSEKKEKTRVKSSYLSEKSKKVLRHYKQRSRSGGP